MVMYDRSTSTGYRLVDEFEGGFGWLAHPEETGQRASHAVVGAGDDADEPADVWLFDPLDAPGIDEEIRALGEVAGVAVCSAYHARDADRFADRFDVPVYVPAWLSRAPERIDAPLERYRSAIGDSGFTVREVSSIPGWSEAIAYRQSDGTLYVPDVLGTAPPFVTADERLAVYLLCRLVPPTDVFDGIDPERVLVGHGPGVFESADRALTEALSTARRGFPRALVSNGPTQLRALLAALG